MRGEGEKWVGLGKQVIRHILSKNKEILHVIYPEFHGIKLNTEILNFS